MIKFDKRTSNDFLDKEWSMKLSEFGVPMNDNKYWLVEIDGTLFITNDISDVVYLKEHNHPAYPTYTLSELIYKIPEWIDPYGGLVVSKDAPFYYIGYEKCGNDDDLFCIHEYPIIAAAQLLIKIVERGYKCVENIDKKL